MSSGNRRVYTTFAMKFEPLGEAEPELLEERFRRCVAACGGHEGKENLQEQAGNAAEDESDPS